MERQPATRPHITPLEDSRRWEHLPLRPDDIIICTPPKCGTTWTQRIVRSLLWPDDVVPGDAGSLSPWLDMRATPIEELVERLEAQEHRRFIKSHTPGDGVPLDPDVRYVLVYRGAADSLVSWGNHRTAMKPEVVGFLNGLAEADGIDPIPLTFEGDYDQLLEEWCAYWSPAVHLAPWWSLRHEPNVHVMHYRDMDADLNGEMKRLAAFLGIEVPAELWGDAVERCRLGAMRAEANTTGFGGGLFRGGADAFFYKGGVGRGRQLLNDGQLDAVRTHVAELLPPDAQVWLESGGPLP